MLLGMLVWMTQRVTSLVMAKRLMLMMRSMGGPQRRREGKGKARCDVVDARDVGDARDVRRGAVGGRWLQAFRQTNM